MEKNRIETKICCKYCGLEFTSLMGSVNHTCEQKVVAHDKIWRKVSIGRGCKEKIETPLIQRLNNK